MKYTIGPHKLRGRRRRRGKMLTICAVLLAVLLLSSWAEFAAPVGRRPDMSASELAHLCNLATYSPGHATEIIDRYPELTPGEIEILAELELARPGFTAALQERYDMQIGVGQ